MSRIDEFGDHIKGRLSLTGWAKAGSLSGMLFAARVHLRCFGQF